jgi:hypothetical protein
MKFFIVFAAVIVLLGIIFTTMNIRAHQRSRKKSSRRRAYEHLDSAAASHLAEDEHGISAWQAPVPKSNKSADDAYREALRRTHRGEALPPTLQQPTTDDEAYRAALRLLHLSQNRELPGSTSDKQSDSQSTEEE